MPNSLFSVLLACCVTILTHANDLKILKTETKWNDLKTGSRFYVSIQNLSNTPLSVFLSYEIDAFATGREPILGHLSYKVVEVPSHSTREIYLGLQDQDFGANKKIKHDYKNIKILRYFPITHSPDSGNWNKIFENLRQKKLELLVAQAPDKVLSQEKSYFSTLTIGGRQDDKTTFENISVFSIRTNNFTATFKNTSGNKLKLGQKLELVHAQLKTEFLNGEPCFVGKLSFIEPEDSKTSSNEVATSAVFTLEAFFDSTLTQFQDTEMLASLLLNSLSEFFE